MSDAETPDQFTRKGDWARWLVLVIIVLALVGPLIYSKLFPLRVDAENAPGVGEKLSLIQLEPLTTADDSLTAADLQGKVVLMNFWGTWCPPCVAELPHIADINDKFRDRADFKLLAVSCGGNRGNEDIPQLRQATTDLLDSKNIRMPTYADPRQETRTAVSQVAGFNGYPTTLILDREGVIRGVWKGYSTDAPGQMESLINRLLSEASAGGG
jgi:cytochrome c biogenesis protein CcmG/thiol:disulfide interchange protein DsbE